MSTGFLALDPLEWIRRITAHIPDPGRHSRRSYGAYSNGRRVVTARPERDSTDAAASPADRDNAESSREARSTSARLIRKIFETDSPVCSCGARMRIVSFIVDPRVVDRILHHRQSGRCKVGDPFEPRAPLRKNRSFRIYISYTQRGFHHRRLSLKGISA